VDIVGTGGDGMDTYNVSTAAGFILAAAGLTVAKHGNRSQSGSVGSADFLEALGADLECSNEEVARVIDGCGYGFLFAQKFHPAMKHVAPVRKEIGVRTVFNLLGPLTNPCAPEFQVTGVASEELGQLFAEVFVLQGKQRAMVVHSCDGMNEISPAGETHAWIVKEGVIEKQLLSPALFGLDPCPLDSHGILGGSPAERAALLKQVFAGEKIPLRSFLVINAAAAMWVAMHDEAPDFKSAAKLVQSVIDSGDARKKLEQYVALSHSNRKKDTKSV